MEQTIDENGQPYARKKYIKGKPQIKIAKFQSGKPDNYDYCVQLLVNENVQIRHMAIEAARLSANKTIEKVAGENGYAVKTANVPTCAIAREQDDCNSWC